MMVHYHYYRLLFLVMSSFYFPLLFRIYRRWFWIDVCI